MTRGCPGCEEGGYHTDDCRYYPKEPWQHLMDFGYAPGEYWHRTCIGCGEEFMGDKRAVSCRKCAQQKWDMLNNA